MNGPTAISAARQETVADLLRDAARAMDRALDALDTTAVECTACGFRRFSSIEEFRVWQRYGRTPDAIRRLADKLDRGARFKDDRAAAQRCTQCGGEWRTVDKRVEARREENDDEGTV